MCEKSRENKNSSYNEGEISESFSSRLTIGDRKKSSQLTRGKKGSLALTS